MAAFGACFTALAVLRHLAFNSGRFDLGNMVQAVWATARGEPLEVTSLGGEQFVRLGSHVDPLLVAFAPLWWLWPSPSMLLTAQALIVAAGAFPVFWLARKHLGSEHAALGFALAYLLYAPVQWLTLDDFHPVALACPLLLFAFWYLDEDRLGAFAVFAVLAASSKEEIPLVVAALGVWYALARRRLRWGAAITAAGTGWAALAVGVVIPHFSPTGGSRFASRYAEVGGSFTGILENAVSDPGVLLAAAFDRAGLAYLAELLLPLAGLFLFAPFALVVAAPELALNLLSSTPTQTSIRFHYTAGLIPGLVAASVLGAARLTRRRPSLAVPLGALAVATTLAANYRLGAIPLWRELPGGHDGGADTTLVSRHDRIAERALELIPKRAVVSASNSLGAHLSARRRILSFPRLDGATWIAVDELRPSYLDAIRPRPSAARVAALRRDPRWALVFQEDGVLVFKLAPAARRARTASSTP